MCGIFGYIGTSKPEPQTLKEVAYLASTRGCHSHGIAYIDEKGELKAKKGMGKINTDTIFSGVNTKAIIGHCRLSTSGEATIQNCQPLIDGGIALVHNGSIRNYKELAQRLGITMNTDCDSEIILKLYHRHKGSPHGFIGDNPYAIAILNGREITLERHDMPLYYRLDEEATYFCSRKFTGAEEFPNNRRIIIKR